ADMPNPFPEHFNWEIVSFRLYVLWDAQGNGTRFRWGGEYAHYFGQSGYQLLRSIDTVPIFGYRFKTVVYRNILGNIRFQLLQYRGHLSGRENIPWDEQYRNPVDRSGRGPRYHIGGPRSNGGCTNKRLQPIFYLGIGCGGMHHALFISGHIKRKIGILVQRLPDSRHVPMPKNPQTPRKKPILHPVPFHILVFQVF